MAEWIAPEGNDVLPPFLGRVAPPAGPGEPYARLGEPAEAERHAT